MVKLRFFAFGAALSFLGLFISVPSQAETPEALPTVVSVNAPKIFPAKNQAGKPGSTTNNLTYHNGPVMVNPVTVTPIYWGAKWSDTTSFNTDKVTGMNTLYSKYGGTNHANISTQYTQNNSASAKTTSVVSVSAAIFDSSTASSATSAVFNKVVALIPFSQLSVDGFYPVYTDLPRGNAGYCAWHSYGTVSSNGASKTIKFAFFFSLDGDSGCDPQDARIVYSQGTEALANVSIHELAEAMTDPLLNAWYDRQGYENADKCAWKFNPTNNSLVNLGTTSWKIQGEWDNSTSSCKW